MKLVKFASALALLSAITACSTVKDAASATTDAVSGAASAVTNTVSGAATSVSNAVTGKSQKTVVYSCLNNQTLTATYTFDGEKATAANVVLGKTSIKNLARNEKVSDSATFESSQYSWSVDNSFALNKLDTTSGILFKKGTKSDEILAKLCKVDAAATAKAN